MTLPISCSAPCPGLVAASKNSSFPPTSTIQTLIESPASVPGQNAPHSHVSGSWGQVKKKPGSHPRSLRTLSTTRVAGRPPTLTCQGPPASFVPGALATAATRSALERYAAEGTTLSHG